MNPQKPDLMAFQHDVRALKDEVKLKMHLAGMDVKDEWAKLEPQIERAMSSASIVTNEVAEDLKRRIEEFKQRLKVVH